MRVGSQSAALVEFDYIRPDFRGNDALRTLPLRLIIWTSKGSQHKPKLKHNSCKISMNNWKKPPLTSIFFLNIYQWGFNYTCHCSITIKKYSKNKESQEPMEEGLETKSRVLCENKCQNLPERFFNDWLLHPNVTRKLQNKFDWKILVEIFNIKLLNDLPI